MPDKNNPIEEIQQIRQMMERSSRFISLSGWSGIFAGIYALAGAAYVHFGILTAEVRERSSYSTSDVYVPGMEETRTFTFLTWQILGIAAAIIFMSLLTAFVFTRINARKKGQKIWDETSRRLLVNLAIPLSAGGILCLYAGFNQYYLLIVPMLLIQYGIALFNAGRYTLVHIRYLGLTQIGLGMVALFVPGFELIFFALGFGVFHIFYGAWMYWKYER